jgi:glycerate kinase
MVRDLDRWLRSYAKALERATGRATLNTPGSGAAGGIGAALKALFDAQFTSGIDTVMQLARFEDYVKKSDLIVTGEGRIDSQTASGKTISGIAIVAKRHDVPIIAIGGCLGKGFETVYTLGVGTIYDASSGKRYSPGELKTRAFGLLKEAARKMMTEYEREE